MLFCYTFSKFPRLNFARTETEKNDFKTKSQEHLQKTWIIRFQVCGCRRLFTGKCLWKSARSGIGSQKSPVDSRTSHLPYDLLSLGLTVDYICLISHKVYWIRPSVQACGTPNTMNEFIPGDGKLSFRERLSNQSGTCATRKRHTHNGLSPARLNIAQKIPKSLQEKDKLSRQNRTCATRRRHGYDRNHPRGTNIAVEVLRLANKIPSERWPELMPSQETRRELSNRTIVCYGEIRRTIGRTQFTFNSNWTAESNFPPCGCKHHFVTDTSWAAQFNLRPTLESRSVSDFVHNDQHRCWNYWKINGRKSSTFTRIALDFKSNSFFSEEFSKRNPRQKTKFWA